LRRDVDAHAAHPRRRTRGGVLDASGDPDPPLASVRRCELTGFDVLVRLQAEGVRLPSIVITGFDEPDAESRAARLGAVKFLRKPVREDEVLEAVGLAVIAKP